VPAFFLFVMLSLQIDIILAILLVIPFHGIFLSLFFFVKTGSILNPNFFLGLLLFVLSSLLLFQVSYVHFTFVILIGYPYYLLSDLLIFPFLFLYNSIIIHPGRQIKIYVHLLLIALNFLLVFFILSSCGSIYMPILILFIIINGLYLFGSIRLLIDFIKINNSGLKPFPVSEYPGLIIFNLLISGTIIISMFICMICPVNTVHLAQVPKGLVIYYMHYRVLKDTYFPY
jgi:hypothetical protein